MERLARLPVIGIAIAQVSILLVLATRYGYHRDELYFIEAGQHLDWGYVDQPPFTPLVARFSIALFGDNLVAIRIFPALAAGLTVVFAAMLAREFGGRRRAQLLTAAAVATSGFALGSGHLLSTATFDLLAWMGLIWIAARMLRSGEARWWVGFGAVSGLALMNKHLVVMLAISVVAGAAVDRRWDVLRPQWLVAGGVL
ncbi:MAG: ArnT family glycosyltransferase, partial [Acidimicrobiia bacterium]